MDMNKNEINCKWRSEKYIQGWRRERNMKIEKNKIIRIPIIFICIKIICCTTTQLTEIQNQRMHRTVFKKQ